MNLIRRQRVIKDVSVGDGLDDRAFEHGATRLSTLGSTSPCVPKGTTNSR
jgi:hypothetical protein